MATLADQISQLSNPNPNFEDSDDDYDDTAAKLNRPDGPKDDIITPVSSSLRKRATGLLEDEDKRYSGKKISRKKLLSEGYDFPNEDSDKSGTPDDQEYEESDSESIDDKETNDVNDIAEFKQRLHLHERQRTHSSSQDSFIYESDNEVYNDESGGSEDDNSESGNEDETESDEISEEEEEDYKDDLREDGDIRKFSASINEDVKKGIATKNQLSLWDSLLEWRIKLHKCLLVVNQLPQPDALPQFLSSGGEDYEKALKKGQKAVMKLLNDLIHLQADLFHQNPETRNFGKDPTAESKKRPIDDEEIASDSDGNSEDDDDVSSVPKKKLKIEECPQFLAKQHKDFVQYRNDTIQKWYDKTRVSSGKLSKGFSAFEQSALKQIEQIMSDKERLVKRTQMKRSNYKILGKSDNTTENEFTSVEDVSKQEHLKAYDENIFDDDDFYHQMLRELIERKTSDINDPIALSRHWLEIQKLRGKMKKNVDTRASKGRKIRYDVHKKLINYMAPVESSTWSDKAKDDLFSSLFDKRKEKDTAL